MKGLQKKLLSKMASKASERLCCLFLLCFYTISSQRVYKYQTRG